VRSGCAFAGPPCTTILRRRKMSVATQTQVRISPPDEPQGMPMQSAELKAEMTHIRRLLDEKHAREAKERAEELARQQRAAELARPWGIQSLD
jgi:hypothetical protein